MINRSHSVRLDAFPTFLKVRIFQISTFIALLLACVVGMSGAARAAELAGATSGELGVSPAGAASYSIPISVPPGTTGMQPSLTLQYSSQAGNGIAGVGWSIGGLSSITRCGTDIHNDQSIDPVDFETDDKFCMNGERLVPIVGTNGADGTEYRTQQEEFSKVISYGSAGTGPAWFRVWKKSGQIFEYGNTADSRAEASGRSEARAWMLNSISDQRGNYIEFIYAEDNALGRLSLSQVNYTGNAAQGLTPYNSVVFDYEARPDTSKAYLAGSVIEQHERLQKVRVLAGATQVRDYTVAYEISGTGRSRPTSVTECGVGGTDCFAPTVFEWSVDGAGKFSLLELGANEGLESASYDEKRIIASGDFNNDGLTDFYNTRVDSYGRRKKYGANKGKIWLSDGDGTFTWSDQEYADGLRNGQRVIATGDFDGDGHIDIYVAETGSDGRLDGGGDVDAFLFGDGAGNFNRVVASQIDSSMEDWGVGAIGDFNGDGLTDLYLYHQDDKRRAAEAVVGTEVVSGWCDGGKDGSSYRCDVTQNVYGMVPDQVWLANRVGSNDITFTKQTIDLANSISEGHEALATGDFNGDGLIDIYTVVTDGKKAGAININGIPGADNVHLSNGPGGFVKQAVPDPDRVPDEFTIMSTGDFNGDGHTDFYLTEIDNEGRALPAGADKVRISKGDGTFENIDVPDTDRIPGDHKVMSSGDFNGDGLTDFYVTETDNEGRLEANSHEDDSIFLSDGKGGFTRELLPAGAGGVATSGWDNYVVAASGDFNGDGLTDLYYWKGDATQRSNSGDYYDYIVFSAWSPPDYLTKVTNGLGLWSEFQYKPMTDAAVYTIGTAASYPENDIITAGQMVHKVVADNGIGGASPGSNAQTYKYEGFRAHIAGVGGLGFKAMTITDDATGIVTESTYLQNWQTHHQGMLERSRTIAPGGIVLKDQQVTWAVSFRPGGGTDGVAQCFRYADTSTTTSRDLNGVLMSTVTEATTYDDYGYPTQLVASTSGDGKTFTKTTDNIYTHNAATWILGRLSSASVTHAATGQTNITRSSSFTYEPTGEIATETVNSISGLTVSKTNAYNAFGAVTSVTETWGEPVDDGIVATSRSSSYTYDPEVRYQLTETNPLGHSETRTFDPDTGLITSSTGPNNLTTSWIHDAFGRVTRETRADGTYTDTIREACGASTFACGTDLALRTIQQPQGGAESTGVADRLLRTRLSYTIVNGQLSYVNEDYDAQGRMIQKSEPYFSGNTVYWTTIQYDLLGRPIVTTRPDNSTQLVTYNGLTQVATNEIGQTKTVTKDAIGQTVSVTDNASNVTTHVYDAIGQMTSMSGPNGNTSTYVYDDRGNKVSDTDPDKGTWTYRYNALGMLVEQTDAKAQVTRITYDVLGRMLTRIDDADSAGAAARTATWSYDTGTKAIGKLVGSTSGNGYSSTATYDSFGRPSQATETIEGTAYTTTTTYDSFSRADSVIYPSGLRTQNVYDANGLLTEIKNYTSQLPYWQLLEVDARGNVSKERLGNGVETTRVYESETGQLNQIISEKDLTTVQNLSYTLDDTGNLLQRQDTVQNLTENFSYDNLNRVIGISTAYGNGQAPDATVNMTYDAIGNITSKTGVGAYSYGQQHGTCSPGDQNAGPNAVTAIGPYQNTPGEGTLLSEVFTYAAADGSGGTSSSSLTITINGNGPVSAVSDTASVQEDALVAGSGNVITNDFGSGLALAQVNATAVAATGSTQIAGTYGTLTASADGTWSYALDNANAAVDGLGDGQTLDEVFTYTAAGTGGVNSASNLTITIHGNSQLAAYEDTASVLEGTATPVTGNVISNDFGSNFVLAQIGPTPVAASGTTVVAGAYGTLTVSADGSWSYVLDNNNAVFEHVDAGSTLSEVFAYIAAEGGSGSTASANLNITINGLTDPFVPLVNLTDTLAGQISVTMSSIDDAYAGDRAIDNSVTTYFRTKDESDEWVNLDLGGDFKIAAVRLINRTSSGDRLNGAVVQLRDAAGNVVHAFAPVAGAVDGETFTYTLGQAVTARSIYIDGTDEESLHIAEIDVFGFESDAPAPASIIDTYGGQVSVSLSSLYSNSYPGNKFIDEDVETFFATQNGADEWVKVDLGSDFKITSINLVNRYSHGSRLNGSVVQLLDASGNVVHAFPPISGASNYEVFNYTLDHAVTARSVYIDGAAGQYMNIAEIDVFGFRLGAPQTALANEDVAGLAEGAASPITGNVISNDVGGTLALTQVRATAVAASGTTVIAGTYGSITVSADGAWSYVLDNANAAVIALQNGETLNEVFAYTASEAGSTISSNLTIAISGITQAVVFAAVDDFAQLQATVTSTINGNVIANDIGSGLSLKTVGSNGVAASGDTTIAGTHGTLTVSADGSWSYTFYNTDNAAGVKNATYCYDANGNQTGGDGRSITYSAFDKPTQIIKGASIVNIWYGPDRARFKREDQTASGITTTRYAMGGAYEAIVRPDLVTEYKHYIGGVAVVSTFSDTQIATTRYLLKDNLGSMDTITDELGAIVQKMSFDAWGKRREIDWTALSGTALLAFDTSITTRGYTGHEMLDPVGLVHMNGRVYDAEIGRFLSADPNIQDVENFQNWNRYTYVLNNPLSYTDPSGFFFSKIFKAIGNFFKSVFKAIGAVFKALLNIPLIRSALQIVACGVGPITCTLAAGALTLLSGGSILEAVTAMAFSFAQVGDWGIWSHVSSYVEQFKTLGTVGFAAAKGAIHGVVGGAISVAQGGNFLEGFAANSIGAAAGVFSQGVFGKAGTGGLAGKFARTASAAVAGGAAAIVAGGKFANGALTAAMAHLYNAEITASRQRHAVAVREIVGRYLASGYRLFFPELPIGVERGVRAGNLGVRFYDAILVAPDGVTNIGLEVKTTIWSKIYLSRSQLNKDFYAIDNGSNIIRAPGFFVTTVAYEVSSSCAATPACGIDVRFPQLSLKARANDILVHRPGINVH